MDPERSVVPVPVDGDVIWAPLFDVNDEDEDELLQEFVKQSGGAIYTWLGCSGADILLRGRHLVNRVAYTVLPNHAAEEIDITTENGF